MATPVTVRDSVNKLHISRHKYPSHRIGTCLVGTLSRMTHHNNNNNNNEVIPKDHQLVYFAYKRVFEMLSFH